MGDIDRILDAFYQLKCAIGIVGILLIVGVGTICNRLSEIISVLEKENKDG